MLNIHLLLLIWIVIYHKSLAISPSEKRMRTWSLLINEFLAQNTANKYSALPQFEKAYQDLNPIFSTLDLKTINSQKANKLHQFMKEKEAIVSRIVTIAEKERKKLKNLEISEEDVWFYKSKLPSNNEEDLHNTSTYGSAEQHRSIHYHNAKCKCGYQILGVPPDQIDKSVNCFEPTKGFRASAHFKNGAVSFEESSVHIPTEVYNGGTEILKDIYLSDKLFDAFYHELCNVSSHTAFTTKWIYFTTKSGAMRYFPGQPDQRDDCMMPDLYDSRITPWYLQSVSSPKDIILLLDNSGSIEGLTLNLIKRSVEHVLDTLTPNDFVNIILFNENITYVLASCHNLLQATPANKQYLLKGLDDFRIANKSNFELGFATAFKGVDDTHLKSIDLPHAGCNSVILLFTDGGAVYPENAVDTWNWDKNHPKRVFSYAVGKNFYEIKSVSHIACRNRGVFHRIPSFGATKEETQKYLLKLGKPMVAQNKKMAQWTLPYPDSAGIGTVTSTSLPVYTTDADGESEFVGVVGADVLLEDIKAVVEDEEMGEDLYSFVIDNNGFVFIHPSLKSKPYYSVSTVDITEFESEEFGPIRDNMIDRTSKESALFRRVFYDENKYTLTTEFLYSYLPVSETAYSLSVVAHHSKLSSIDAYATLTQTKQNNLLPQDLDSAAEFVSTFLFNDPCPLKVLDSSNACKYSQDIEFPDDTFTPASNLSSYTKKCDSKVFSNLLLHAWVSKQVSDNVWLSTVTNASTNSILGLFYATESPSFLKILYNTDEEMQQVVFKALSDPAKNALYRRAIHATSDFGWVFMLLPGLPQEAVYSFTAETLSNNTNEMGNTTASLPTTVVPKIDDSFVLVARAVRPFIDHPSLSPAVVGVVLNASQYQERLFQQLTHDCDKESLCSAEMRIDCSNIEETVCLLIDDGGFLIFSNQPEHEAETNKFIGWIDGGLTRSLVSNGLLNVTTKHDSQTMCTSSKDVEEPSSALRSLVIPSIVQLLNFGWWMSSSAFVVICTAVQTLWMITLSLVSSSFGHANKDAKSTRVFQVPPNEASLDYCLLQTNVLQFTDNHFHYDDTVSCNDACNRSYSAMRVPDSNLMLIVLDFGEGCLDDCVASPPFENKPVNIAKQQLCQNTNNLTIHRQSYGECFDSRKIDSESDNYCGHASKQRLTLQLLLMSLFIFIRICQH